MDKCRYCNPGREESFILSKIDLSFNCNGKGIFDMSTEVEMLIVGNDGYLDHYATDSDGEALGHKEIKINYCPMCGRKLKVD